MNLPRQSCNDKGDRDREGDAVPPLLETQKMVKVEQRIRTGMVTLANHLMRTGN